MQISYIIFKRVFRTGFIIFLRTCVKFCFRYYITAIVFCLSVGQGRWELSIIFQALQNCWKTICLEILFEWRKGNFFHLPFANYWLAFAQIIICPGAPADMEANYPNSLVKFSNLKVGTLGSTYPGGRLGQGYTHPPDLLGYIGSTYTLEILGYRLQLPWTLGIG